MRRWKQPGRWLGVMVVGCLALSATTVFADDEARVKWKRIVGVLTPNGVVGGFMGAPAEWTAGEGRARLNLETGAVEFEVRGLVLAAQPPALAPGDPVIGTTGVVTQVKGTVVCNATVDVPPPPLDSSVDTPGVPLSETGNAHFEGTVLLPAACLNDPGKMAFLIRASTTEPATPLVQDRWLAFGAVRKIRD